MIFKTLRKWLSRQYWQRNVVEVMAKLSVDYNSYYQRTYDFLELLLQKPVQLIVSTQFVESRVRFKQSTSLPILIWEVDFKLLQNLGFKHAEVFKSAFANPSDRVRIFIPEPLTEHFQEIIKTLKEVEGSRRLQGPFNFSTDSGIITSSGRTFWVGWNSKTQIEMPMCFKIDTLEVLIARDYINYRGLSPEDAKLAVLVNDLLEKTYQEKNNLRNFFNENLGLHLQSSETDHRHRYVTLERFTDFEKTGIRKGDFLLGMQVLVSPDFWQTKNNLKVFEISSENLGEFFRDHLVRGFSELIRNSVETTFLHFEIHQQNLTCHLRNGRLQRILVHDLQDVIFDPVSFLFSYDPAQWPEKILNVANLYKYRFFNFYGEQRLNISKHNNYFVPATFYRRYFRNFGNYTRIFNQAAAEDYLMSRKLEALVVKSLNYSDEELGLTGEEGRKIKMSPDFSFLREHLFWVISRRVCIKQQDLIRRRFQNFSEKNILNEEEKQNLFLRAQREVCFFSANLPERMSLQSYNIQEAYSLFEDKVYVLRCEDGQLAALLFIPTIGV